MVLQDMRYAGRESLSGLDLIRFLNAGKATLDRLEKLHADYAGRGAFSVAVAGAT